MSNTTMIVLGVIAVLVVYVISMFNGLVVRRNRVKEGWSDIETQLKRRYDLIPNLVETVKGYAKHEATTLENAIKARNAAMGQTGATEEHLKAENALSQTLKSIFALSEAYPDLKANQNFLELQREITDTEDKIQASRRFYNSAVLDYNNKTEMFPDLVIARMFSFTKSQFFEVGAEEKEVIQKPTKVQF